MWSATVRTDGTAYLVRHLVTAAVGLALALLVSRVGQQRVRIAAPWAYAGSLLLLLAVLTPVGRTVNGSRSWTCSSAGSPLQPAELAKVGLCLALGDAVRRPGRAGAGTRAPRGGARPRVLVALLMALILLQPDLGSAAVVVAIGAVVVTVAGVPRRWVVGAALLGLALVVVALTTPVLSDYQRDRLTSFADPSADPQGSGYQTRMVRLAIGAGGMWGQGFQARGAHPGRLRALPAQRLHLLGGGGGTLGFVGATGLLLLLAFVVGRVLSWPPVRRTRSAAWSPSGWPPGWRCRWCRTWA